MYIFLPLSLSHSINFKTLKAGLYVCVATTPSRPTLSRTFQSSASGLTRAVQFSNETIGVVFSSESTHSTTVTFVDYLAFKLPVSIIPVVVNESDWCEFVLLELKVIEVVQQSL